MEEEMDLSLLFGLCTSLALGNYKEGLVPAGVYCIPPSTEKEGRLHLRVLALRAGSPFPFCLGSWEKTFLSRLTF